MRTQLTKTALAAGFALAITFTLSCSGGDDNNDGGGSSSSVQSSSSNGGGDDVVYGGETYQTVVIGEQTWMARNLNYNATGSVCYDNKTENCVKYGRLYDWATAKTVCPSSWHLPDDADWDALITALGGLSKAGTKLKATSGWNWDNQKDVSGNGTDESGFSALPGGRRSDGDFRYVGNYGYWWSASEDDANAYRWDMYYDDAAVDRNPYDKTYLCSVRCLKD
jgi:uncharacterized protein (TIGR02145 family)